MSLGNIDIKNEFVIYKFLDRYDYDGVEEILKERGIGEGDLYKVVSACKYLINFDFNTALKRLEGIDSPKIKNKRKIKELRNHLLNLIEGYPEAIFSELIESLKMQCVSEQYIDYLGRVYRLKEALLKYIFISGQEGVKKKQISMIGYMVSKNNILKMLRKRYKIYSGSLSYGLMEYIKKMNGRNKTFKEIISILNSKEMENLIKLRHECPVGHGFKGVSRQDIQEIYGEPQEVMKDFVRVCTLLDLKIKIDRHDDMNRLIEELVERYVGKRGDGQNE